MPTLQEFWKPVFNRFDPWWKLDSEIELARFYVERENSPLEKLITTLQFSREPQKALLVGHIGSGKTSSLARLRERLKDQFFVVELNAETGLNTYNVGHAEVLVNLGLGVYFQARERKIQIDQAKFDGLVESLRTLIIEQGEEGAAFFSTEKVLEKIGLMIKYGFKRELSSSLEVGPTVPEIVHRVNDLIADAEKKIGNQILVTIDGLDRLDVDLARKVFAHSTLLTRPACHVVYTIPITLRYDSNFDDARANFRVCDLPNFKVNARNGDPYPSGRELLAQVIHKRLADYVPADNPIFTTAAMELLVAMSGGLLRDLMHLCQSACGEAVRAGAYTVDESHARTAVLALTGEYAANLRQAHWEELQQVHQSKLLTTRVEKLSIGGEVKEVVLCDQLLEGRHIFAYANHDTWFDVHPVLTANLAR